MSDNKKYTPSTSSRRPTRSAGPPDVTPVDWQKASAAARKLAPGGSGGKGIQMGWFLPTEEESDTEIEQIKPMASLDYCAPVGKKASAIPAAERSIIENQSTIEHEDRQLQADQDASDDEEDAYRHKDNSR